ncbi:MAG: imidazoleglycerol-phosphate dehydratase [Epulopiscium sp. Nuni2H_MBin003]|nr:MAG: imidazoleglycerol-phosphate dehydratase [Epulopiscium sp. Nuni2H_MBin003]
MREITISRKTNETDISLKLNLDGTGKSTVNTGCGFLNHMLTLLSSHSKMDIDITCIGDVDVDFHHTVEDIGICLGDAIDKALADKRGINRYGTCTLPMDEALITVALDFSGRSMLVEDIKLSAQKVGDFDTELCKEFLIALSRSAKLTLHVMQVRGENNHHIIEGIFKALAKAIRVAISIDKEYATEIPSTKGVI